MGGRQRWEISRTQTFPTVSRSVIRARFLFPVSRPDLEGATGSCPRASKEKKKISEPLVDWFAVNPFLLNLKEQLRCGCKLNAPHRLTSRFAGREVTSSSVALVLSCTCHQTSLEKQQQFGARGENAVRKGGGAAGGGAALPAVHGVERKWHCGRN